MMLPCRCTDFITEVGVPDKALELTLQSFKVVLIKLLSVALLASVADLLVSFSPQFVCLQFH